MILDGDGDVIAANDVVVLAGHQVHRIGVLGIGGYALHGQRGRFEGGSGAQAVVAVISAGAYIKIRVQGLQISFLDIKGAVRAVKIAVIKIIRIVLLPLRDRELFQIHIHCHRVCIVPMDVHAPRRVIVVDTASISRIENNSGSAMIRMAADIHAPAKVCGIIVVYVDSR